MNIDLTKSHESRPLFHAIDWSKASVCLGRHKLTHSGQATYDLLMCLYPFMRVAKDIEDHRFNLAAFGISLSQPPA
jgi:hypothetical protein